MAVRVPRWPQACWMGWCLAVCLCLSPALVGAQAASAPVQEVLNIGLMDEFAPYQSWTTASPPEPEGLDVARLTQAAKEAGKAVHFVRFTDAADMLKALQTHQVLLIGTAGLSPDQLKGLVLSRAYRQRQQALVGRQGTLSAPAAPDLAGYRLALVEGDGSARAGRALFPLAKTLLQASRASAMQAVLDGQADFALIDRMQAQEQLRELPSLQMVRIFAHPAGRLQLAALAEAKADVEAINAVLGAARQAPGDPPMPKVVEQGAPLTNFEPLRVGYFPRDHPSTFTDSEGRAAGVRIEMFKAMARRGQLRIREFVPVGLKEGLDSLAQGRLDVLLGVTEVASRRDKFLFVGPYASAPLAILSREDEAVWSLQHLRGRRLAMVKGFFARSYIATVEPEIEQVECANSDACMAMVERGEADATLYGLEGLRERLRGKPDNHLEISGVVDGLYDEDNLVVTRQRPELAARLRSALDVVAAQDMATIDAEWAASVRDPGLWQSRMWRWGGAAGGALLLVLLAWRWHSARLQREIRNTQAAKSLAERYLAFMAHEVRNALQGVQGAATLLSVPGSVGPGDRQAVVRAVQYSSASTLQLLDGLLDRHLIQEGRLEIRPRRTHVGRAMKEVVNELRPAAEVKGLTLTLNDHLGSSMWRVDAMRLQQVLRNLLVNAIKFSDLGAIVVDLNTLADATGGPPAGFKIEVRDQGRGMDPQHLAAAMEGLRSEGGDRPGTGLGLGLVRELMVAMGGTATVHSTQGVGTHWALQLPAHQSALTPSDEPGVSPKTRRVLLVEDSLVLQMLLEQALKNEGCQVQSVTSLSGAVAALGCDPAFDLVLSDVHLEDGVLGDLMAARDTRASGERPWPPIIGMTAGLEASQMAWVREGRLLDMLDKGHDAAALVQRALQSLASGTQSLRSVHPA